MVPEGSRPSALSGGLGRLGPDHNPGIPQDPGSGPQTGGRFRDSRGTAGTRRHVQDPVRPPVPRRLEVQGSNLRVHLVSEFRSAPGAISLSWSKSTMTWRPDDLPHVARPIPCNSEMDPVQGSRGGDI